MSAHSSHVQRMTTGSASERGAGLDGLKNTLGDMSEEQLLEVVREPGLLAALNVFFSGDKSLTALKVLFALMRPSSDPFSPTTKQCRAAIFDSPCFPSLKDIAASSSGTLELKRKAWRAIRGASRLEVGRRREVIDSPGMVALLQVGLESADHSIAVQTMDTIYNLCRDETTAAAVFDGHPDLVQSLVDTFCNSGVNDQFKCKSQLHSFFPHIKF